MSVRGTMTSRAIVSPSANTEWIMSRSPCSTKPRCSARSTSSRSSTCEANGPSRKPLPGVNALPIRISSDASGFRTRPSQRTIGAANRATVYACWRPIVLGATPTTTKVRIVIEPATIRADSHWVSRLSNTTSATSVVAPSSQNTRSSNSRFRCRTKRSPRIACSAFAPRTPSRTISATRAADTRCSEESVIANRPPRRSNSTATMTSWVSGNP